MFATNPGVPPIPPGKRIPCPTAANPDVPLKVMMELLATAVTRINSPGKLPLFLQVVTRLFASTLYVEESCGSSQTVGDKSYGVNPRLKDCDVGGRGVNAGGGNLK